MSRLQFAGVLIGLLSLLTTLIGAGSRTAMAAGGTDQIILDSQWRTDGTGATTFKLNSEYNGKWLDFDWGCRLPDHLDQDNYAMVHWSLGMPQLSPDLKFNLDYRWDDSYQLWNATADYSWQTAQAWEWGLGYGEGWRDGLTGGSPYRYRLRKADAKLDYNQNPWSYSAGLAYTAKDYPITRYYTSERLIWEQTLRWQPERQSALYLSYQETAADYPYDESLTRSYYKTQWQLGGRHKFRDPWDWTWEASAAQQIKGLNETSYTRRVDLDFRFRLGKGADLQFQVGFADRDYSMGATPGEDESETDLKSRTEQKTALICSYPLGKTVVTEAGWFWTRFDYDATMANDPYYSGLFTTLTWKPKPLQVVFKAAPCGDLNRRVGYYQLQLKYIIP